MQMIFALKGANDFYKILRCKLKSNNSTLSKGEYSVRKRNFISIHEISSRCISFVIVPPVTYRILFK